MEGDDNAIDTGRRVLNYIEHCKDDDNFKFQLGHIARGITCIFKVNIAHIREIDPVLADRLLYEPCMSVPVFEAGVEAYIKQNYAKLDTKFSRPIRLSVTGPLRTFGENDITPLVLCSEYIRRMIRIYGIVTKCSDPTARVQTLEQYSAHRKTFEEFSYSDPTINLSNRTTLMQRSVPPFNTYDSQGYALTTDFGLSVFHDTQRLIIQTTPEDSPAGSIPRTVTGTVVDELVDKVKPGDRVLVTGVYLAYSPGRASTGARSPIFRSTLLINHIECVGGSGVAVAPRSLAPNDVELIRRFLLMYEHKATRNEPTILEILGAALCPSVWGYLDIKKGLVLELLRGETRHLSNGLRIRGDINTLLLGDPGTAKSQILRYMASMTPGAVCTTGRGTSGAGLTAAVVGDNDPWKDGNEKRLEAGAMVLADRSLICIDEFDKMSDDDRTALHEAMEQQTVTVNKAGIHCTLNARCSVLAAANPPNGNYNTQHSVQANINLPDSLLSRFDLIWIIIDTNSTIVNTKIANHVMLNHVNAMHIQDNDDSSTGAPRNISRPNEDLSIIPESIGSNTFSSTSDDTTNMQTTSPGQTRISNSEEITSQHYEGRSNLTNQAFVPDGNKYGPIKTEVMDRIKIRNKIISNSTTEAVDANIEPNMEFLNIINNEFFMKLLKYLKTLPPPKLSVESASLITNFYSELRSFSKEHVSTVPVTARTLETLIRLTIARAKLRLTNRNTTGEDVREVYTLLRQSLFMESYDTALINVYTGSGGFGSGGNNNNNNNNNNNHSGKKGKHNNRKDSSNSDDDSENSDSDSDNDGRSHKRRRAVNINKKLSKENTKKTSRNNSKITNKNSKTSSLSNNDEEMDDNDNNANNSKRSSQRNKKSLSSNNRDDNSIAQSQSQPQISQQIIMETPVSSRIIYDNNDNDNDVSAAINLSTTASLHPVQSITTSSPSAAAAAARVGDATGKTSPGSMTTQASNDSPSKPIISQPTEKSNADENEEVMENDNAAKDGSEIRDLLEIQEEDLGDPANITDERYKLFKNIFSAILKDTGLSSITVKNLISTVNKYCMNLDQNNFTLDEYMAALKRLSDEELIMVSEGEIFTLQ